MDELLACRVCLITDVKLFDMYKYKLAKAYETLTGSQLSSKGLPVHICSFCAALLQKSASFKTKCDKAESILKCELIRQQKLTTAYLRTIDRKLHSLNLPLTNKTIKETVSIEEVEVSYEIKKEESIDRLDFDVDHVDTCDVSVKYESDEEPLSETLKKKKNNKKAKVKVKVESEKKKSNKTNGKGPKAKTESVYDIEDIEIKTLNKDEQLQEVLARKTSANYMNSFYKCDNCFKGFLTDETYKNHMAKHDLSAGPHVCGVCHMRWPSTKTLRNHIVTSHERKYVCKKCKHVSNSCHGAKEHSKGHLGFTYTCKICGATFKKSSSHLTHLRRLHPSEHSCGVCGEAFIGQYGLAMHKKKAHRIQGTDAKENTCKSCGIQFWHRDALERHKSAAEGCNADLKPCRTCGEGFLKAELLKEHLKTHLKRVRCKDCNKSFVDQKSLATHYHRAHLGGPARQQKKKLSDRAVCELCGKKFPSAATLRYHQRVHTGEKPYSCPHCPKRFASPIAHQVHIRTHTGERPYACPYCPKAFNNQSALIRHNRVHTGLKPYQCPECDKSFSQSNSRKLHIMTVHQRQPTPYKSKRRKNEKYE